jgi:predicted nucleotidyltransferase
MTTGVGIDQALMDEIVRRVLAVARPERIILFGSAAAGGMTPDSDIDLLVLEADPGDRRRKSVRIRRALRRLGYPFDVVVMATDHFENTKDVAGAIASPVSREGKVIYEAP